MKWRQLFWVTVWLVELAGCTSENTTGTPTPPAAAVGEKGTSSGTATGATRTTGATGATRDVSIAKPTPDTPEVTARSLATSSSSLGSSQEARTRLQASPTLTTRPGTSLEPQHGNRGVPTTQSQVTQLSERAETSGSTGAVMSNPTTPEHPSDSAATTTLHPARDSPKPSPPPITCHNVREESDTGALCLQLNESSTCKHFLERKGLDLWKAICEKRTVPNPCKIKLAQSELVQDCLLLILVGEKDPAPSVLQESHWEKLGIKSLKKDSVRNHQDFSQKTLIALVTSGLLLAFLGLAGYFLMKRRSWSPAGERLAEDPYYTENGSQGNTMLMTPSQEQAELQEKPNLPNLNGGTQENGTGQASSKNGHSARQHSPADTEM